MIEILNSICEHLAKKFNYPVYIDTLPNDFKRPSFYVEFVSCINTDLTFSHQREILSFQITYFGNKDEFKKTSTIELLNVQQILQKLFYRSLKIENDYIKIDSINYTSINDALITEINLDFDLEITQDNPLDPAQIAEIMRKINIKYN